MAVLLAHLTHRQCLRRDGPVLCRCLVHRGGEGVRGGQAVGVRGRHGDGRRARSHGGEGQRRPRQAHRRLTRIIGDRGVGQGITIGVAEVAAQVHRRLGGPVQRRPLVRYCGDSRLVVCRYRDVLGGGRVARIRGGHGEGRRPRCDTADGDS